MEISSVEVYPRPDGTIYICGIGGSDYISKDELKTGAFREVCDAKQSRVEAASGAFQEMSSLYSKIGELDRVQACMRPCPPDALPYMGRIPGFEGAFINAGHNCWYVCMSLVLSVHCVGLINCCFSCKGELLGPQLVERQWQNLYWRVIAQVLTSNPLTQHDSLHYLVEVAEDENVVKLMLGSNGRFFYI